MVGSLSNINTDSKTMRHGEVSERCETGLPRLYQYPHNTLYITKLFMQLFLIIPLSSLSNIVCNLINCGVTCRREIMHVGGPMIATKIPAPMGSPWHSLVYLPLLDRLCVKINYFHCHYYVVY